MIKTKWKQLDVTKLWIFSSYNVASCLRRVFPNYQYALAKLNLLRKLLSLLKFREK